MQEAIHKVDDVLVFAVFHNQDFIDDQIFFGLEFQVHLLNRDALIGAVFISSKDTSRCTLANLVKAPVFAGRVTWRTNGKKTRSDIECVALSNSLAWSW